jgi:3-dehydroquinate synthetase
MLKALRISEKICDLDSTVANNFEQFLKKLELNTEYKFNSEFDQLRELLSNDKKFSSGTVKYVLLQNTGEPILIDYNLDDLLNEVING